MRTLTDKELTQVSGAGDYCPPAPTKKKGNNGFGNGANDGVPGGSGFSDDNR